MVRRNPLPPYLCWRDGRPRWEPGPKLRQHGHRGQDLKTADGAWMALGQAIDAATAINAAIAAGEAAPAPVAAHTFSALCAAFKGPKGQPTAAWKKLAPRTREDYSRELAFLESHFGDVPLAAIKRVDAKEFYATLIETRGLARANAILRVARLVVNYAIKDLEWREIASNRFAGLDMETPVGRLVMWEPDEIRAFVACADWLRVECDDGTVRTYESQGDAQILGVCTGQNRADVITAPPFVPVNDVYEMTRRKTGRKCFIPRSAALEERLTAMRARQAARWPNVHFATELVSSRLGTSYPADGDHFIKEHAKIRAVAAGVTFALEDIFDALAGRPPRVRNLPFTPCPGLLHKTFQDLRDTAVTLLYERLGDIAKVVPITGHSLKTAQDIIDNHYFVRRAEQVKGSAHLFDDFLSGKRA